jgi:hypothetical protein
VLLALSFGEVAAFLPLGAVLGFAALFLKRWWKQQDDAMAAAIAASDKEGAKCEERMRRLEAEHDADMAQIREDLARTQAAVRQLIPMVPPEAQTQLWDLMWTRNNSDQSNALAPGPPAPTG